MSHLFHPSFNFEDPVTLDKLFNNGLTASSELLAMVLNEPSSTSSSPSSSNDLFFFDNHKKDDHLASLSTIDLVSGDPMDFGSVLEEDDTFDFEDDYEEEEASPMKQGLQMQFMQHQLVYLGEIQKVLDICASADGIVPIFTPPSSPMKSSSSALYSSESDISPMTRKSTSSFKVDHHKVRMGVNALKRKLNHSDEFSPESPAQLSDSSPISPSSSPSSSPVFSSPCYSPPAARYNGAFTSHSISPPSSAPNSPPSESSYASMLPPNCLDELRSSAACATILALCKRPELITMKQSDTAKILGISTSVLSKRWREATKGKKWPHRIHHKLQRAALG